MRVRLHACSERRKREAQQGTELPFRCRYLDCLDGGENARDWRDLVLAFVVPLLHSFQHTVSEPAQGGSIIDGSLRANPERWPWSGRRHEYEVYVDGVLVDLSDRQKMEAFVTTVFGLDPDDCVIGPFIFEGAIAVPKDGAIECLSLKFHAATPDDFDRVISGLYRFRLRIEYQSLFGDELVFEGDKPALPPKLPLFGRLRWKV